MRRGCAAVAVDARIHDPQLDALQLGEHADRGAALEEIGHHLHRHLARVSADAAVGDAMIRGEDDPYGTNHADVEGRLNRAHLGGEGFEPAQGALRLGQPIQAPIRGRASGFVN